MNVIAEIKCDRCNKIDKRSLTLGEAQALSAREKAKEDKAQNLELDLNEVLTEEHPDIIVAMRSTDGKFYVRSINNLCIAGPEAKRNKGCKSRVDTLIREIFMDLKKVTPKKAVSEKETLKKETPKKPLVTK